MSENQFTMNGFIFVFMHLIGKKETWSNWPPLPILIRSILPHTIMVYNFNFYKTVKKLKRRYFTDHNDRVLLHLCLTKDIVFP